MFSSLKTPRPARIGNYDTLLTDEDIKSGMGFHDRFMLTHTPAHGLVARADLAVNKLDHIRTELQMAGSIRG